MSTAGFLAGTIDSGGGLEIYELAMARELSRRDWDIAVAYEIGGDLEAEWRAIATTITQVDETGGAIAALRGIDVLYVHSPSMVLQAIEIADELDVPIVMHLHLPPEGVREGWKAKVAGKRQAGYPHQTAMVSGSRISRFIAVSAHTASLWVDYGIDAAKIDVVHNGIDTDRFRPGMGDERAEVRAELGIPQDAVAIGFIGRIDPNKGIEELLRAHGQIRGTSTSDTRLVILGEATRHLGGANAPYSAGLRAASGPDVIWLGRRTDPERIVRGFDLVVVPSLWPEPFGLVAIEAMASGVAVITSDRGGLPEVMGTEFAAQVVDPKPARLASAIAALTEQPDQLRHLGTAGRARVLANFSLDSAGAKTERRLASVLP